MNRRHLIVLTAGFGFFPSVVRADSYERFFKALRMDDAPTVAGLLARGFDPNTVSERGEPALVTALRDGHLEVAEALWKHADLQVDRPNLSNETALMMAALRGMAPWVRRLIDRGAAVNRTGWAPIHYAASGQDVATLRALLAAGAVRDAPNPAGSSALILAARFGSDDVVMALLEAGADPRKTNPSGQDAAAAARWAGRERLADRLAGWTPPR